MEGDENYQAHADLSDFNFADSIPETNPAPPPSDLDSDQAEVDETDRPCIHPCEIQRDESCLGNSTYGYTQAGRSSGDVF